MARKVAVKEVESGMAAERRARIAVCSNAGKIGRVCRVERLDYVITEFGRARYTEEVWMDLEVAVSSGGMLVTWRVT